jgi:hypothetical protein
VRVRRSGVKLRALVISLAMLLAGVGLTACGNGDPTGNHLSTSPETIDRALVSADGLDVFVAAEGGGCTTNAVLTATEGTSTVALHLTSYSDNSTGACPADAITWTRSVTLTTPLDARRLVDGATGHPVSVFDGRDLAKVGWLPPGASRPKNSLFGGWTRTYDMPGNSPRSAFLVSQQRGTALNAEQFGPEPGDPQIHLTLTTVHGLPARLVVERGHGHLFEDRLGWVEDGYVMIVAGDPRIITQPPWPPRTLERIANGLRLPASKNAGAPAER